ncbi:MAG: serine hydrolase domain-containing protein [Janthinobacterium lividum]
MRQLISTFLLLLLGLTALRGHSQQLNPQKLDSLLTLLTRHEQAMGSLAITRGGQVVYSRAFGAAQVRPLVPATPATRYRADYLYQVFTEVLLFQLIEENKLTLDTPLATFFPQLPNAKETTIDYLRTARSGLTGSLVYDPTRPLTQRQVLDRLLNHEGGREVYPTEYVTSSGYLVLQFIVEKLAGQSYAQAVQQHILTRASLEHTYFTTALRPQQQEALLYERRGTGWQLLERSLRNIDGTGTLVSTPTDLNRFLTALYGGKLLSAAHRAAMQQGPDGLPHVLYKGELDGQPYYSCIANLAEPRATCYYFPAQQLAVSLCLNGQYTNSNQLLGNVLRAGLGKPYSLPKFAPPFTPDPLDLSRCLGTFSMLPLRYTVVRDGPTLRLESAREGNVTLEPVNPGVFRTGEGNLVEFSPDRNHLLLRHEYGAFPLSRE